MGNINSDCCPKSECVNFFNQKDKNLFFDVKVVEKYPFNTITYIQALYRGYLMRKKLRKTDNKLEYMLQSTKGLNNTKKSKENKDSLKVTPNGEKTMPGKLISEKEIENIRLNYEVSQTEQLLGPFIIEEKEVMSYLADYKNKLKKNQMLYENGNIYIGYYDKEWRWEGYGILMMKDGGKYEGMFKNNKMSGRGRLIGLKGDYYEGEFKEDLACGFGKYVNKDGGIYIGYWRDDKQHGRGEELFSDGSRYEGFYNSGLKHDKGKFTWPNGSQYDGDFVHNVIQGYGVFQWRDGKVYRGQWRNNQMEGLGILLWSDKKKYFGQYLNDKKSGYGVFMWPGGKKYEGQWLNGKQNGFGIFVYSDVKRYGIWNMGQKDKWVDQAEYMTEFLTILKEVKQIFENLSSYNDGDF